MALETGASRFVFVDKAQVAPAQCVVTGQITGLVDLGRTIPMYGRLYLSKDAIRELAEVAGVIEHPGDATLQQHQWYEQGYQAAVEKDFDGTLRGLISELGLVADRLSPVDDLRPEADESADDIEQPESDGPVAELDGPDEGEPVDSGTPRSTGSGKRRSRVQRDSVNAGFEL